MVKTMIHRSGWGLIGMLAPLAGLFAPTALKGEEDSKPVVVVSIASVDHLMEDFVYLTKVAGRQAAGEQMRFLVSSLVQDFDRTRPAGVLITLEDNQPKGVGFLPIPDSDKVLRTIRERFGADVDDLGGGIKKLGLGRGAYLKQQGKWLFFTDHPRHLAHLPDNPAAMLGGLDQQYAVAVRLHVSNIPQGIRDVTDYAIQTKIDADLKTAVDQAEAEIDVAYLQSLRDTLKRWASTLINDSDQITIGWDVDPNARRTFVELLAQAKEGSVLSQQLDSLADGRSAFTGFLQDDAAIAFQGAVRVTDEGQRQVDAFLTYFRSKVELSMEADPHSPEPVKEIVRKVLDVVEHTAHEGRTDAGATLLLAPESFRFAAGVHVADGHALADAFQQLFEMAKNEPNMPEIHFFAAKHQDLDLHTLVLPIAENDQDARKILGEKLDITIATGADRLYVALGTGGDQLLKTVVDRSAHNGEQKVPPLHLQVAVRPIVDFLASVNRDQDKERALAEAMQQATGGDKILLQMQPAANGLQVRLEIEEGVLELLSKISQQSRQTR